MVVGFSKKIYKTLLLNLNMSNLFSKNLIKRDLRKSPILFGFFQQRSQAINKNSDRKVQLRK